MVEAYHFIATRMQSRFSGCSELIREIAKEVMPTHSHGLHP